MQLKPAAFMIFTSALLRPFQRAGADNPIIMVNAASRSLTSLPLILRPLTASREIFLMPK